MRSLVNGAAAAAVVLALAACNTHVPKHFYGHAQGTLAEDSGLRLAAPASCPQIFSDYHSYIGINSKHRRTPHNGIDFPGPQGTPIIAAAPGTVVAVGATRAAGRTVVINHGADAQGNHIFSASIHLSETRAAIGQHVERGQVIGTMGSTGANSGRVVHLHFQTFVLNDPNLLEVSQSTFFVTEGKSVAIDYYSAVNPHDLMIKSPRAATPTMARADEVPTGTGGAGTGFAGFTYPIACG